MKKKPNNDLISNRRASHDYHILETYSAGIVLTGTEVKSIKNHQGSLQEAYVTNKSNELWLINATIPPYSFGNVYNHEEKRERKLLMHSYEMEKIIKQVKEKGMTLIPLAIYLKDGWVKLRFASAKGKKSYDKRAKLKEKEHKKSIDKAY